MSFFKVEHDKASEGGLVPEGSYEVVVSKAFEDAAKSGTGFINLHLVIRNDVDQSQKNRYIFGSIWKSKDTGEYHSGMLNAVAKAIKIENGKQYNTLDEMLKDFIGKTCKVSIKHEEYNGYTNANVKKWEQSKYQNCNHIFEKKIEMDGFTETSNDDIPF